MTNENILNQQSLLHFFILCSLKCIIFATNRNLGFLFSVAAKESSGGGMCLNNEFVHRGRDGNRRGFVYWAVCSSQYPHLV